MTDRKDAVAGGLLVPVALVLIVALGVGLRLEDPLSSPAIGAEDPYTHVVFTKEHLRKGYFDDVSVLGTSLYPPGLHAFSAIFAPLAGVELYDWARFSPAFFGALSVLGMGILAWRLGGPAAGLAAALLVAVIPEHIVRTYVFFPTMVDLALLPAFFLAFLLAARGVKAAAVLAFLVTLVLAYTHPWIVPLSAGIAALYFGLRVMRGAPFLDEDVPQATTGSMAERARLAARRLALPAGLSALFIATGAVTRWDHGNTGFVAFLADLGPLAALAGVRLPVPLLFAMLLVVLLGLAAVAVAAAALASAAIQRAPGRARLIGAWVVGGLLALVAWRLAQTPPEHVYYDAMLGPVPIALALLGVVLAAGRPSTLGDMALALSIPMFPFTALPVFQTVFDAEYWPSRAVVYLSLGVALLGAVAVAYAVHEAARLVASHRASRWVVPVAALSAVMLLSAAVAASPARADPWYRLYSDEEFAAFERTVEIMEADPKARVVVADWQPGLYLKTLGDPYQVRYGPKYYNLTEGREKIHDEDPSDQLYVLVDRFLLDKRMSWDPTVDLSFLEGDEYELVHSTSDGKFRLYKLKE